jgi:ureidoacrylate peracid hydrolase
MRAIGARAIPTTLAEIVEPASTAVLVVDLQNDLCSAGGTWPRRGYDLTTMAAVVSNTRRLLEAAHGAGVPVIYIQMSKLPELRSMSPVYLRFLTDKCGLAPEEIGCEPGTWGAEIVPEIAPQPGDIVLQKWRSSAFVGTPLDLILRSNGIQTVVVCGVATNACVESTVRDAFNSDYYVVLAEDCVGAYDLRLHQAALEVLRGRVDVVASGDLISLWADATRPAAAGQSQATVPEDGLAKASGR